MNKLFSSSESLNSVDLNVDSPPLFRRIGSDSSLLATKEDANATRKKVERICPCSIEAIANLLRKTSN